jgi:hypothetical protein
MYSGNKDKKNYTLDNLITPTRKTTFEDSEEEDDEEVGFDPPPVISPDILTQTPVIRLTTPVRKKEESFSIPELKEDSIPTFKRSPRKNITPQSSPVIDISDEDEINERVAELVSFPGDQDYSKESKSVKDFCLEAFKIKFSNLKVNYPDRKAEFPEGKKLERIHKIYHNHIKNIYVNMNLDQI